MAKRRPYTTNPTTGAEEWLPSADALDAKINVSGPDVFLGRKTADEGGHEELTISGLPAETTPASGDLLLLETAAGVLSKLDIANLPAGGGDVATDAIWDTKGDLAVATAANTAAKLAVGADGLFLQAASGESTGLKYADPHIQALNAQTGTSYTLVLADHTKLITLSNASAITLTVPPNSSVAFAIGSVIDLAQIGAGQVTVAQGSGVTVNATPGLKFRAQYAGATLRKIGTDSWLLFGDLSA